MSALGIEGTTEQKVQAILACKPAQTLPHSAIYLREAALLHACPPQNQQTDSWRILM